jgi:Sec-independent protein translocase protein TatA
MGFHPLDIIVLIGVALLLFGPRTLQSISHSAGRGMGHARDVKDKLMKELPVDELSQVSDTISRIPTSPQQVAQKLIGSALKSGDKKEESPGTHETAGEPSLQPE